MKPLIAIFLATLLLFSLLFFVGADKEVEASPPRQLMVLSETVYLPVVWRSIVRVPEVCRQQEPNNIFLQAIPIVAGMTIVDCIDPVDDEDWWTFSLDRESRVEITGQSEGNGEEDIHLDFYDHELTIINSRVGFEGRDVTLLHRCGSVHATPIAGAYFVRVKDWSDNDMFLYIFTLQITACPMPIVLTNHTVYTTASSALYVVGEVRNPSNQGLYQTEIVSNLFGGDEQLIDTARGNVSNFYGWILPPNDKGCFEMVFSSSQGWTSYQFEPPTYREVRDNAFPIGTNDPP